MDNFSPIIVTSKQATDHLEKIKAEHADILTGIQNQKVKVEQYKQKKLVEQQNKQMQDKEIQDKQMQDQQKQSDQQDKIKKDQIDAETKRLAEQNKAKELDIKAQALTL